MQQNESLLFQWPLLPSIAVYCMIEVIWPVESKKQEHNDSVGANNTTTEPAIISPLHTHTPYTLNVRVVGRLDTPGPNQQTLLNRATYIARVSYFGLCCVLSYITWC